MQTLISIFLFLIYILITSYGLYKIKASQFSFNFGFIIGFIAYGIGFVFWLIILKFNPLSIAFPIASSLLIIGTQLVGYFFLNEQIGMYKVIGVSLIIIGILVMSFKSH